MPGASPRDPLRDRLVVPIALGIFGLWMVAGFVSLVTRDVRVFLIASGPFGGVCGYVFGIGIVRRAVNGNR